MKDYWQLRKDLKAVVKEDSLNDIARYFNATTKQSSSSSKTPKKSSSSYKDKDDDSPKLKDYKLDSYDNKLFLKITKGKKDKDGLPDFSNVTMCDIISLPYDEMAYVRLGFPWEDAMVIDAEWGENTKYFLEDWKLNGWSKFEAVVLKLNDAFQDWFGSNLMGRGKSSVLEVFKAIRDCPTRANWTIPNFSGTVYRGKTIPWDKAKQMKWKQVGSELHAEGIYQSRLGAQSWTTDISVAKSFARNSTIGDANASGSVEGRIQISGISGGDIPSVGSTKISGWIPVVVSAAVPKQECILNAQSSKKIGETAGLGVYEREVIRVSNTPIKAKFIITKESLRGAVRHEDSVVEYIYKTLLGKKK